MKTPLLARWLLALSLGCAATLAAAAGYPDKPVKMIVSLPPGSGADTTARFLARHLTEKLGQPFLVENRPGADSFIAARAVATAPADGYTMFVASNSPMVTNVAVFRQLPYDAVKDFQPLARIARFPMVLVVPASSPFKTLQDLVAAARLAPGKLNFGSGTATYRVALELLHERNQIKATAVPYKGTSAAMTDLAGGNIDYTMAEVSAVMPLVRGGKVRALAVAATERIKELPQVPTVSESGTPGYESYAWTGVFFPAGVPEPVLNRASQAIRALMESDEAKAFITLQGGAVFYSAPQAFGEFQRAEIEKTRRIVKTANIGYED
ncbi:Bug family tripartite tricarboxylate transporter substrate binding protein [Variovorax sp. PAMC26660]|uniref:Bug family tripartite tricarboxylate transporter substrate binding protein n=1 Tax=Variovorax sp. PAMC26660 TaxID=2762322 RepID=UPI00164E22C4|nr:tripartite tricarboxylate transporter substrate binding protein [Variovorax sp. PAMC26660]QNK67091.1 tripartite tricarboxylate transporter substrate binding protein [Variovorax sp. PAMC26660]